MRNKKKNRWTISRHLIALLMTMMLAELVLISCVMIGWRVLLAEFNGEEMRRFLTTVPARIADNIARQHLIGNDEAVELLVYELLKERSLERSVFLSPNEFGALAQSDRRAIGCEDFLKVRFCLPEGGTTAFGAAEIRSEADLVGYLVQEVRVERFIPRFDYSLLKYLSVGLLSAFFINSAGILLMFRRRFARETNALKEVIAAFHGGRITLAEYRYRVTEFEEIAQSLSAAVKLRAEVEQAKVRAVTAESVLKTTQMLAHDIRRPFTKLRSGLTMLENVEDGCEFRQIVSRISQQVDTDLVSVNHMLSDILVAGNDIALNLSSLDPHELILTTLTDICALHSDKDVHLDLNFEATRQIHVDSGKISRVLANILDNALQAMPNGKHLWIRTRLVQGEQDWIETSIGNSGSLISSENLERIFSPFFTKGKKNGTGLGLSIVQRIIEAHGGKITCSSRVERGTEFIFTLPAAEADAIPIRVSLPASSKEARGPKHSGEMVSASGGTPPQLDAHRSTSFEAIASRSGRMLGNPLRILVVDDEHLYVDALERHLAAGRRLIGRIEMCSAKEVEAAISCVRAWDPELVICDIDLGNAAADGFDLVARIRGAGFRGKVCVHSNRSDTGTREAARDAGADMFLPKPLSRKEFLDLLSAASREAAHDPTEEPESATVAVVDDDVFMLEAWEAALACDCVPITFSNPADFWDAVEKDPELLAKLSCVVTDFHFDNYEGDDGVAFAEAIHRRAPRVPVVISSNADLPGGEEHIAYRLIDKTPRNWAGLATSIGFTEDEM